MRCTVYIGSEATFTATRYKQALAKGIAMRQAAEAAYELAAAKAKRKAARAMRLVLTRSTATRIPTRLVKQAKPERAPRKRNTDA